MPQMDKAAFFSQLFWLMVTFYGFYMITVKTHLPNLARILKVRKKSRVCTETRIFFSRRTRFYSNVLWKRFCKLD